MTSERKHVDREHVFVILRADLFLGSETALESLITAKEVVRSQELAKQEVARLNALHPDGAVRYWYTISRLYAEGSTASSRDA